MDHRRWLLVTSAVSLVLLAAVCFDARAAAAALLAWSLLSYLRLLRIITPAPTYKLAPADGVSALRVVLCVFAACPPILSAVLNLPFGVAAIYTQAALFLLAIGTDFLDGFLARRTGCTRHGEILDMEADQILVLSLALSLTLASAHAGALAFVALLLPALKYAAVIVEAFLNLEAGAAKPVEGDNRRAKGIYAVVLTALVTGLPALGLLEWQGWLRLPAVHAILLLVAVPLLAFSFGADLMHKLRAKQSLGVD